MLSSTVLVPAQVIRPIPVPGRIEAENYDTNGANVSYYDVSVGNNGNVYRFDDVDIEACTDTGGGYNVGWISAGEWLNYTINVAETAVYRIDFRVAAQTSAGTIQVALDNLPFCGTATPVTGGWQTWQTVSVSNLVLRAGVHVLRLDFATGGHNLNYLQVTKQKNLTGGYLRVSGKQIVNAQGENVQLKGFGLGNWMIQEPYMMDVTGIAVTQSELKTKIAELVGTSNMQAFYTAWLTNYMREADVTALAAAGFNSVRLPMHFALFTLPVEQEPVPGQNTWIETGFNLVNDLARWCASNQMYLILDMHGCPGGQGYNREISDYNPPLPSLWDSAANRAKYVALWREIARRYATNVWIGGYDIINEPNWTFENNADTHGGSDQTNAPLRQVMMDATAAIREVDTNHIVIIEGNGYGNNYNGILPPWDNNLVISFHKYWDQPTAASFQGRLNQRDKWNMPIWLGETGENSNEWFRDVARWCAELNIGWSWWPWKKIGATAGPVLIQKPAGYQAILNYWRNGGTKPATNTAMASLLEFAAATRLENCSFRPDVLDSLIRPYPLGATLPLRSNTVPGIFYATDYDLGRQGEAYLDITTTNTYNSGSAYRNDSVDIQATGDTWPTNGYNVGWIDAGDWMKYTASTIPAGAFSVAARVASLNGGGKFYVEVAGSNVTGLINVPATGGWQSWTTLSPRLFTNTIPADSFRIVVDVGGFNLNWVQFNSLQPVPPAGLTAAATPTQVQLTWNSVSGAAGYKIKRAAESGGTYLTIATGISGTNFTDVTISNAAMFFYVVTAINSFGESASSNEASVAVPLPRLAVSVSATNLVLSWSNSASAIRLRSATNLMPPVIWLPVTNAPMFQNGRWQVPWPPSDGGRFFQLSVE
ncbi:MAG: carbohydrate-binding protein [Verrucomicrobiota bacterium]